MSLEAGRVLSNRYRLVRPIGQGSQGSVWIADHLALNTHVAVKLIDPELAKRDDARERFKREATAAAQLRSAHVVQILDHGIDEGQPFIVMEMLEGEDLFERLNTRIRLSLRETSKIITQVARALARAHAAGITHRDLKPENVFLCNNEDDEVVKVLDFGVAKVKDPAKRTMQRTGVGTLIGTPHYMSPEQVKGIQEVDHRTDLWALGVMTYQCVVGDLPFDSEGVGDLLIKISMGDPPIPSKVYPGLPAAFDAWFARACSRDPDKRFQSARELAEALARVVASVPEAMRGELPPRPASIRPPPVSAAAPTSTKTPPPRPAAAKATAPPVPPRVPAKPAPPTPTPAPSAEKSQVLDLSDLLEVSENSGPAVPASGEDVDFDFDFDFDNEPPVVSTGFPPVVQPAPATRTAIPAKTASGIQPPPARPTPQPFSAPARATPMPAQRMTPPPGSAPHAIPPPPGPAGFDRVSDLGAPVMPHGLLNSPAPMAARTAPATAPGVSGGVLSIPPPPELDGSRRRRTLAYVGVAFVLIAGGLAWVVVQSNMGGTNASPAISATPPMHEAEEPPPVVALPSPTSSFGETTTPNKTGKGARPTATGNRNTTKTKATGGTTTKKKTPGDDTTIEVPEPTGEEPPAHVEPQSPEPTPAPAPGGDDTVPPAP